jgi:TPR repeat protein
MIFRFIALAICLCPSVLATQNDGEELMLARRYEEAFAILTPKAEKGDRRALYILGVTYLFSDDEAIKNEQKGLDLLHKSAYQGYGPAYNALGDYYLQSGDEKKAFEHYKKSADFGFGPGQFNVGAMYKNGQGTPRDPVKAFHYLSLASVNHKDLSKVAEDAGVHRDKMVPEVPPHDRQKVLAIVSDLARPEDDHSDID